ncbi:hypothetical protein COJ46_22140 [Bacillus sp. AFS077874]|uniref:hypothetical protein n=1 Tax=Bacillus sp. AFS077874 TaxID=2033513 RepID=UPI000BFA7DE6|nr:hypothetical protein [Bacillus sp. AFS077874]PFM75255.1 hypothetical protein COJ46_22140 [Bacillus sp. AFS077874]
MNLSRFTKKLALPFVLSMAIATPTVSTHAFAAETSSSYTMDNVQSLGTQLTPISSESYTNPTSDGTASVMTTTDTFLNGVETTSSFYEPATEAEATSEITPVDPLNVQYPQNYNLTDDVKRQRYQIINQIYGVGEEFSPADAEFIAAYGYEFSTPNSDYLDVEPSYDTMSDTTSSSFSKTKTYNGVSVKFTGKLYSTIGLINHSYRGNVTSSIYAGGSSVTKLKNTITNIAYGAIGSGGVGKVYEGSTSGSTTTSNTLYTDKTVNYSAVLVAYTYTNAYTTVTTSSSSFNLYAF